MDIEKNVESVRVTKEAVSELQKRNLSVSINQEKTQRRSVKQTYLTSAGGYCHAVVVEIKDRNIESPTLIHLNKKRRDGGVDIWVAFNPHNVS